MLAARVAAALKDEKDVHVEVIPGGLGELSVSLDGRKEIRTSRLWYARPGRVVNEVKALLGSPK